jgi:hypothetical protein
MKGIGPKTLAALERLKQAGERGLSIAEAFPDGPCRMTKELKLPRTTWGRIVRREVPVREWLPRVREAAARLSA